MKRYQEHQEEEEEEEKGRGELASPSSVLEIIYFTQRISYNIALTTDCDAPKPFGVQHSVHVHADFVSRVFTQCCGHPTPPTLNAVSKC